MSVSLLSSCATPTTEFYTLKPINNLAYKHSSKTKPKYRLGIGPVTLTPLVDRSQIVTLMAGNTVQIAEFQQWASPVKDNISEVLAINLALLSFDDLGVLSYPWSIQGVVDYRLLVDIRRFDTGPTNVANLTMNWTLMSENTHSTIASDRISLSTALADSSYASRVKMLNEMLNTASKELATIIARHVGHPLQPNQ